MDAEPVREGGAGPEGRRGPRSGAAAPSRRRGGKAPPRRAALPSVPRGSDGRRVGRGWGGGGRRCACALPHPGGGAAL